VGTTFLHEIFGKNVIPEAKENRLSATLTGDSLCLLKRLQKASLVG
jgi:hypothetical protein